MTEHRVPRGVVLVAVLLLVCCKNASAPFPPADTKAVPEKSIVEETIPASLSRADALLAEMKQREGEFKKLESELRTTTTPVIIEHSNAPTSAASTTPQPGIPVPAPSLPPPAEASAIGGGHDERWWKDQARALNSKLEEAERLAAAAAVSVNSATLRITQDEARAEYLTRLAAVGNVKADLGRLHEDARRASVPPGWLRWP